MAFAGPYPHHEIVSILILAEKTVFYPFFIDIIAILYLDAAVYNGNQMNSLLFHILNKLFKIGKGLPVNGKVLVPFHIIDVKVNAVQGNMVFPVPGGNLPYLRRRCIAPPALPESESPFGRKIARANQLTEPGYDVIRRASVNEIQLIIPVLQGDFQLAAVRISDIKNYLARRIKKQAELLFPGNKDKIMRPVKGFGFFQMDRVIRTIALIDPAPLVHAAHIFSQAVHDILFVHFIYKGILTFPQIRGLIPACRWFIQDSVCLKRCTEHISFYHKNLLYQPLIPPAITPCLKFFWAQA